MGIFFFELDAGTAREHARGLGEGQILELLHELDDVAARTAAEAFETAAVGMDVKRGRLLPVEMAEAHETVAAFTQLHICADESTDSGANEDFADGGLVDPHKL